MIHELATIEKQVRKQASEARHAAYTAHQMLDEVQRGETLAYEDVVVLRRLMMDIKHAMRELTGDA